MKVLLVNSSPHHHGCTDVALQEVAMLMWAAVDKQMRGLQRLRHQGQVRLR